jgi:hypothetical protein
MKTIGSIARYVLPMVEAKDAPKNVVSFPTWVNEKSGKSVVGFLSLSELRTMSTE